MSNAEDHNSRQDVEQNLKKILDNLKQIKVPTVDISYYHNGTPSSKVPTLSNLMGLDKSEIRQDLEDSKPDVRAV